MAATEATYELTIFMPDGVTRFFDVGTDPDHFRPYLKVPASFPEQEVAFAKGSASIGQLNIQIVDVPTDPNDQDTGFLTEFLGFISGYSNINGRRARLTEDLGTGKEVVLDGVVRGVRLLDNFVTYELELRDNNDRARTSKAFATTTTPTLLPRGVLDGYGFQISATVGYPVGATQPLTGTYRVAAANNGVIVIDHTLPSARGQLVLTAPVREALLSVEERAGQPGVLLYNRWKVLWRDKAGGGAYSEITDVAHYHPDLSSQANRATYLFERDGELRVVRVNNPVSGDTLPSDSQVIEFIVAYDGPPTSDWRFHLQDLTAGELLRNLYRGDYSEEDPRILYNEAALLALATPVRMRLGAPVDDVREWAEKNIYPIVHAAPTLNAAGEIAPITYLLPDASEVLPELGNSNCRPAGGGWSQSSEDAINVVRVTYDRLYRIPTISLPGLQQTVALSDTIQTREVVVEHRVQESIDLIGEQVLEIKSELLSSIGLANGGPWSGDVADEAGAMVAERVARMVTDRFSLGGQYFALHARRTDASVEALAVGSWVTVGVSWMPDYESRERGLSRLAQVVSRRNIDPAWTSLTLIDAGSNNAPLTAPTLGTVTADTAGVVSIPVDALGAGSEARVEYAVNATEPGINSELWTYLGRATSASTLTTPPLAPSATAWIRSRGEGLGRRPSVYTTPVSVTIPTVPSVTEVEIVIDAFGVPTVSWSPNAFCLGVRVHYEVHDVGTLPTLPTSVDADSADLEIEISSVFVGVDKVFSVEVEPWDGWTGSAVSGSAGVAVDDRQLGVVVLAVLVSLGIHFDDKVGTVAIQVTGSPSWTKGYFTVGLGSAPSDPTTSVNDGTLTGEGELVFDGAGDTTLKQAAAEQRVFVKCLPENDAAITSPVSATYSAVNGVGLLYGGIEINAETERILFGAATAPLTGVGVFLGKDGADYEFRAGDPAGDFIHWDGTNLDITGTITATSGTIGGWTLSANDLSSGSVSINATTERILFGAASAPLTGAGVFLGKDGADYEFRAGDPAGDFIHWDGTNLNVTGTITATSGTIGGWTIGATTLTGTNVVLDAGNEQLRLGSAVTASSGTGVFIGKDGADYELRAGVPGGNQFQWNGTDVLLNGARVTGLQPLSDITLVGFSHDIAFSATDNNTVAWGTGTITNGAGASFSIVAGNTGNMAAATYIFLDRGVSSTILQTTTTAASAMGADRVLVAVANDVADAAKNAEFLVYGGSGGVGLSTTILVGNIAAGTITGNEIITMNIAGKNVTFDAGTIGGWTLSGADFTSGSIALQSTAERIVMGSPLPTAPLTNAGIFIGKDGADYEFRVGDPGGSFFHYDGTNITLGGTLLASTLIISGDTQLSGDLDVRGNAILQAETAQTLTLRAQANFVSSLILEDAGDVGTGIHLIWDGSGPDQAIFKVSGTTVWSVQESTTVVDFAGEIRVDGGVDTDDINEFTSAHGVEIDGVLLKDGGGTFVNDLVLTGAGSDIKIAPDARIYFDGGTHTYITQESGDRLDIVVGGVIMLKLTEASTDKVEVLGSNLEIDTGKKFFLDGGGDTYIYEPTADIISMITGGTVALGLDAAQNVIMKATGRLYLDGGINTYIYEVAGDNIRIVAGSQVAGTFFTDGLQIEPTKKVYFDGGVHTYISESSADTLSFVVAGGTELTLTALAGIFAGDLGVGTTPTTDAHTTWSHIFVGQKGSIVSERLGSGGVFGTHVTDNLYIDDDTGVWSAIVTNQCSRVTQEAGIFTFANVSSTTAGAAPTLVSRFTIGTAGQVSIYTPNTVSGTGLMVSSSSLSEVRRDSSSRRWKTDVDEDFQVDVDAVLAIKPKEYGFPGAEGRSIGFIVEDFHDAGFYNLILYDEEGPAAFRDFGRGITALHQAVLRSHDDRIGRLEEEVRRLRRLDVAA